MNNSEIITTMQPQSPPAGMTQEELFQTERVKMVDDEIIDLVNRLVPAKYKDLLPVEVTDFGFGGHGVDPHRGDWVAKIRAAAARAIFDDFRQGRVSRQAFNKEFYSKEAELLLRKRQQEEDDGYDIETIAETTSEEQDVSVEF